jgi:DNA-binding MarR family transcriptional regulator
MDFSDAERTIADQCLCLRLRQGARTMTRLYDEALRPLGVQTSQLSLLVAVACFGEDGAGMGALADAVGMDRSTLTRNVRPLERAALLRVARSARDARSRSVSLTPAGERLIEAALPLWKDAQASVKATLGKANARALQAQLDAALAALVDRGVSREATSDRRRAVTASRPGVRSAS